MNPRTLIVGIDEAGYGPILGPLVVSASIFESCGNPPPADFWQALQNVPVHRPGAPCSDGLVIGDSKQVYDASSKDLSRLAKGVLTFAATAGVNGVASLEEFLRQFGSREFHLPATCRWYDNTGKADIEDTVSPNLLRSLLAGLEVAQLRFHGFLTRPVFEAEFNHGVARLDSKSDFLFEITSALADEIIKRFPACQQMLFYHDKQGGRNNYGPLLLGRFPGSGFLIEKESRMSSVYQLMSGGRRFVFRFEMKGDDRFLPIGLASMCSKYVRELFLGRFNHFWQRQIPGLRPTAGYYTDAQRFLEETQSARESLGIQDEQFIRSR